MTIGNIHHFFCCLRKLKYSAMIGTFPTALLPVKPRNCFAPLP
jgi:hypothetical protein